ncbi:DNA-directed RNA polymerase subunit beta [Striga asiatica]|uniref:DNA-directed RNA polymerase subunit beta n=1 Tax=Striga asiatica TaxID=4170 RepID=A0A5A7QHK8_STRAF|nr:DNA-directed RNA polymerase subunit beta [Striga asiatica]
MEIGDIKPTMAAAICTIIAIARHPIQHKSAPQHCRNIRNSTYTLAHRGNHVPLTNLQSSPQIRIPFINGQIPNMPSFAATSNVVPHQSLRHGPTAARKQIKVRSTNVIESGRGESRVLDSQATDAAFGHQNGAVISMERPISVEDSVQNVIVIGKFKDRETLSAAVQLESGVPTVGFLPARDIEREADVRAVAAIYGPACLVLIVGSPGLLIWILKMVGWWAKGRGPLDDGSCQVKGGWAEGNGTETDLWWVS